jgi:hypothetical protein
MINKIRSQQIIIDLPTEDAPVWVQATLQKVIKDADYNTAQTIDRVGFVNRTFSDFMMQIVPVTDPVTGQSHVISGAAIALLIRDLVSTWIVEDRGGIINDKSDVIEE